MRGGTHLVRPKGLGLKGGDVNFLVALALLAERAIRQLASLVGHEVASLGKHEVLQVQHLPRSQGLGWKKTTEANLTGRGL